MIDMTEQRPLSRTKGAKTQGLTTEVDNHSHHQHARLNNIHIYTQVLHHSSPVIIMNTADENH